MNEIHQYLKEFKYKTKKKFFDQYSFNHLKFNDFQWLNFALIEESLESGDNLFIGSFNKELPSLSKFPTVLSVAISMFFKNYCDSEMSFQKGDIIQKNRQKFKIISKTDKGYWVFGGKKNQEYKKLVKHSSIKEYSVVTTGLSSRKVKTGLKEYKEFYNTLFSIESEVPSKFKYKSAIVLVKKEFEKEIKNQKYLKADIKKSIPMRWITAKGKEYWKDLPIEPMIYCVPDFETLEEYVLDKGIEIETLVVIGKNKYKEEHGTNIKRAVREGVIKNCIILGSEELQDKAGQFLKWNWTYPEFAYLMKHPYGEITVANIQDQPFEQVLKSFIDYLSNLEKQHGISLKNIKGLRKFLYALVLAKRENSRNLTQLEYVKHLIGKVTNETIYEEFYNQNLEPYEVLEYVNPLIQNIFNCFNNEKLKFLEQLNFVKVLIVPEKLVDNWKEELQTTFGTICSFKEFMTFQHKFEESKNVFVLSLFGNGMNQGELIETAANTKHNFNFLTYPEEAEIIELFKTNRKNNLLNEYKSKDRKKLSGIKFEIPVNKVEIPKSLGEIMDELYDKQDKKSYDYEYESQGQVNYQVCFEDQITPIVIDGSKTVLILKGENWIKTKTYNLVAGDTVRIYNNLSKEKLFEIAAGEDNNGRFAEIIELSQLWKKGLRSYFSSRVMSNKYYDTSDLLEGLRAKGATITNPITVNKWLDEWDKERFPNDSKNIMAIKTLINSEVLNQNFDQVLKVRSFYRGVMISLGRDLSDDVMDYVKSRGLYKGRILSKFNEDEIQSFIHNAAPIKKIQSIKITNDEESNG